ncbi:SDR family NAD(P)-dependent oxidoreductase [Rubellimicrobium aerolatum]|uniref:SDR family NAD(P)-dependent oxidoreductase n=1 Tax=Rubellimicrobium aerolatum TaxID=490979 RepID=A0ABW0SC70_9RHOB|nr:SDR family oxidoreductase [Rubellimicrobium aerolatum]MBP1806044.1 3-oxoacyl-[acyl-carrier protein] reductase [Rubellimicrobium aerolatum]
MKPVLVTGTSRGLGLAILRRLLDDPAGYTVAGLSRTRSPEAEALAERHPGRVDLVSCDLSDIDALPAVVSDLARRHGPFWGLVNNAGLGLSGVLATMHRSDIERMMAVNLMAPIVLTKAVSRGMLAARQGRVVNISSIIAATGFHGLGVYAATKAGLEGLTRSLARELGKRDITVNCVAPGFLETGMTLDYDPQQLASIRRRAPLGVADPADVAGAVAYLLGPEAAKITGTVLTVDGGSVA